MANVEVLKDKQKDERTHGQTDQQKNGQAENCMPFYRCEGIKNPFILYLRSFGLIGEIFSTAKRL